LGGEALEPMDAWANPPKVMMDGAA
jgi:hypothetical protein